EHVLGLVGVPEHHDVEATLKQHVGRLVIDALQRTLGTKSGAQPLHGVLVPTPNSVDVGINVQQRPDHSSQPFVEGGVSDERWIVQVSVFDAHPQATGGHVQERRNLDATHAPRLAAGERRDKLLENDVVVTHDVKYAQPCVEVRAQSPHYVD